MKRKKLHRKGKILLRALSALLIVLLAVILIAYLFNLFLGEGKLTDIFQGWTKENRVFSYVLYLIIAPLINLVPGISSMFTIALANMLFNYKTPQDMALTFALCATSVVLTSSLMFLVGRLGGKKIVNWIAGKENTEKFQKYLTLGGKAVIPMMYALPFFPDDTICLIAGMTDMSFLYNFLCTLIFRNFGVLFMCVFGTIDYSTFSPVTWVVLIFGFLLLVLGLALLSYCYYRFLRHKEEGRLFLLTERLSSHCFYEIHKARKKDLTSVQEIYDWGRKRMYESGNTCQWDEDYPTIDHALEDFWDSSLYVLRYKGKPVACFSAIKGPEENYENLLTGKFNGDKDYVAIHRLCSMKKGGGKRCLEYIQENFDNVRIDTSEHNKAMQALLTKCGYEKVGTFTIQGLEGTFLAYEHLKGKEGDKAIV